MLDPLLVALWQATTAERRGLAKNAPGPAWSSRGPLSLLSVPVLIFMIVCRSCSFKNDPSTIADQNLSINHRQSCSVYQ